MGVPYAEVIGDPIGHSKSPLIHRFWLEKLGIGAEYRPLRLGTKQFAAYLADRKADSCWRGCNVTAPLKSRAAQLVGTPTGLCDFVGAVNCIVRTPLSCMFGTNTDLDGIGEALTGQDLQTSNICLIGAGGAARAALCYLVRHKARSIAVVAREAAKAEALTKSVAKGSTALASAGIDQAAAAIAAASILINATPMGMTAGPEMEPLILNNVAAGQTVFDMVYAPVETDLLRRAGKVGAKTVDGLTMLIGQAAPAFELFFGEPAPRQYDGELRKLLKA